MSYSLLLGSVYISKAMINIFTDILRFSYNYKFIKENDFDSITRLDIPFKIHIISSYITELQGRILNLSVKNCCTEISSSIQKIHNDLNEIDKITTKHRQKWFHRYRTIDSQVLELIHRLEIECDVLDSRFSLLKKIVR